MDDYLPAFLIAAAISAALTWLLGVHPGPTRKGSTPHRQRRRGLPRVGGPAIFLALLLTPFLVAAFSADVSGLLSSDWEALAAPLLAGVVVLALGTYDDLRGADFRLKFVGQSLAGLVLFTMDYRVDAIGLPWGEGSLEFSTGYASLPLTLFWVVLLSNAVNLIDGKDGVAAGIGLLAAAVLAFVADDVGNRLAALLLFAVAGGALGFLPFNVPPARRYLGDSGALLLGFTIAALSIPGARGPSGALFLSIPVMALGFPLLDTALAVVRRFLDRHHVFFGDEDHIHHRVERVLGFGPRRLAAALYALSMVFGGSAYALHRIEGFPQEVAVFALFFGAIAAILFTLGYPESLWNAERVVPLRRRLGLAPLGEVLHTVAHAHPRSQAPGGARSEGEPGPG